MTTSGPYITFPFTVTEHHDIHCTFVYEPEQSLPPAPQHSKSRKPTETKWQPLRRKITTHPATVSKAKSPSSPVRLRLSPSLTLIPKPTDFPPNFPPTTTPLTPQKHRRRFRLRRLDRDTLRIRRQPRSDNRHQRVGRRARGVHGPDGHHVRQSGRDERRGLEEGR